MLVIYSHGCNDSTRHIQHPSEGSEAGPSAFRHGAAYLLIGISSNFGIPSANVPEQGPVLFVPPCEFI